MDVRNHFKLFLISVFISVTLVSGDPENTSDVLNSPNIEESGTRVLSRPKRFLTFPDGSSVQLVFCTQNHGYLQVGDIVWFANTAALAWELPTDPLLFNFIKKYEKKYDAQRRTDQKHIIFLNDDGKVISTKPYHRRPMIHPAFAKRSIDDEESNSTKPICKKEMHQSQKNMPYFVDLDDDRIEFHREGRKNLYEKLEVYFQRLGYGGKECVLRMLCESKKPKEHQGTFLEEILRATFTLPRSTKSDLKDYDRAHVENLDCEKMYPQCVDIQGTPLFSESQ